MTTPTFAAKYKGLKVSLDPRGICVATFSSKEQDGLNFITGRVFREFADCVERVAQDPAVKVFVVRSADEDFWLAHMDVRLILKQVQPAPFEFAPTFNDWYHMCERLRGMPKATIAEVVGRCGGGGQEFAMNFDMRFGVVGRTTFCQMEVPLGISPGGTGCVSLPRLVGTGRAMEAILGGVDVDAERAERWGLLNRAFPSEQECRAYVDQLAARIAGFRPEAVAVSKASILANDRMSRHEALLESMNLFNQVQKAPEAKQRMEAFLQAGGQTRAGELDLQGTLAKLSKL